jgi:hypothetical protein
LAFPVILGTIAKQKIDLGQRECADGSHAGKAGRAVERPLQWDRNLLFDFFRGKAGYLGGDLSRDRAEKWVGVDR